MPTKRQKRKYRKIFDIAVIGTGEVGGTLGRLWAAKGHRISYGSRTPQSRRVQALVDQTAHNARAMTPREAVSESDLVVLATPWPVTRASIRACGSFKGKMILDCTNPFNEKTEEVELTGPSGAERISRWAKTFRIVKSFNTVGANLFGLPKFGGQRLTMYSCGDHRTKQVVHTLTKQLGFEVVDCGPLKNARLLEALCGLWINLAPKRNWKIAFRLVHE